MHRIHSGLTVAVAVKNGATYGLRRILRQLNTGENKCFSNFINSKTTLFISGVIIPEQDYHGELLPETLVLATTYCGPLSEHLNDIIQTNKNALVEIFRHCNGFPEDGLISDENVLYFLKYNSYYSAFNSRYNCITKEDVQNEKHLREEIENYTDRPRVLNAFKDRKAVEIKSLIQRHIKALGDDYQWAQKQANKTNFEFIATNLVPVFFIILLSILVTITIIYPCFLINLLILLVVLILAVLAMILFITRKRTPTAQRPDDKYVRKIAATQLNPVLNGMTAAAPLKQGKLRRYFYASALRIAAFFKHSVMDVPTVSSIRWLVIDQKKRLLFFSNYANTTDFYVRDFLNGTTTPRGVNFMFSNGIGFPDAKLLICKGIKSDPEGYMNAVHSGQKVTDLWYAHDKTLTAEMINKNRKLRNGLFRQMSERKAMEWLKLL